MLYLIIIKIQDNITTYLQIVKHSLTVESDSVSNYDAKKKQNQTN